MESVSEFFAMGGYAGYIWPAYGLTALVLGGLLIASWRSLRHREKTLKGLEALRKGGRR